MKRFIFLLGPPGVGKGTHGALLDEHYTRHGFSCRIVGTGKYFREKIGKGETLFKQSLRGMISSGELVPEVLPLCPLTDALFEDREYDIYILDGMCRSKPEVNLIEILLDVFPVVRKEGVYIDVPPDVIKRRLLERNRGEDDSVKAIEKRLEHFERFTAPTIQYLKETWLDFFWEVNGDEAEEEVHQEILDCLNCFEEQGSDYHPTLRYFHKAP